MRKIRRLMVVLLAALLLVGCADTEKPTISSVADLNDPGIRIGVATGAASDFAAREVAPEAEFVDFIMIPDGCAALIAGSIDAFVLDEAILSYYAAYNPEAVLMEENLGVPTEFCVGMAPEDTELCEQINEIIAQLREDGTLEEMEQRWIHSADGEMPELQAPQSPVGTLRMMTEGMLEPFNYVGDGGAIVGFDVELGQRIAYALGMDLDVQAVNFDALIPSLEAGKCDVIISGLNATPERSGTVLFSDCYVETDVGILVLADRYGGAVSGDGGEDESGFWATLSRKFTATFVTEQRWKLIANGLWVTVEIAVLSLALATLWGGALLAMERSGSGFLRGFSAVFQIIVSGTPVLIVLMVLYYIVFKSVNVSDVLVAVLGFGLYNGAGLSGVFRTGIDSVDKGQWEAAAALGFRPFAVFKKIVLPQAVQRVFGLYKGEFVSLMKATSVVGYITIQDLTRAGDIIRTRTYDAFFPIIATAVIYFAATWVFTALLGLVELRLDPKKRQRTVKGVVCK